MTTERVTTVIPSVLILSGSDRLRKLERVRELAHRLAVGPLDWHTLDAAACAPGPLNALIRERPLAGAMKLIVIDDAHRLDRACIAMLDALRASFPETTSVFLLIETLLDERHPLAALAAQGAVEHYRAAPQEAVSSRGGFALLNAIARRNAPAALQELDTQLAEGREGLEILGSLVWQLSRWVTVAQWRTAGVASEEVAASMKLQAWQLDRTIGELRGRTVGELRAGLERCWELDVAAKSGRVASLRMALEQLVLTLCQPAPSVSRGGTGPWRDARSIVS